MINTFKVFMSCVLFCLTELAFSDEDLKSCDSSVNIQEICSVRIDELRPLQIAFGYLEFNGYRQRIRQLHHSRTGLKLLDGMHQKPIILGPEGTLYLLADVPYVAALNAENFVSINVQVIANYSKSTWSDFWLFLQERGWIDNHDEKGRGPLSPDRLPLSLRTLADDPYKSLTYLTLENGGFFKSLEPKSQAEWARFLRERILLTPRSNWSDFERATQEALRLSISPEVKALPGSRVR